MHAAIAHGAFEVVDFLLRRGFNLKAPFEPHETPLELASLHGHERTVDSFLKSVQYTACEIGSALSNAASRGHARVVERLLLDHKLSDAGTLNLSNAIITAGRNGYCDVMEQLLDCSSSDDLERVRNRVFELISVDKGPVMHLLSKFFTCDSNMLTAACSWGREAIVAFILDEGVDPNNADIAGQFPLHLAAYYGRMNVVKYLLEHGAKIDRNHDCIQSSIRTALEGLAKTSSSTSDRSEIFRNSDGRLVKFEGLTSSRSSRSRPELDEPVAAYHGLIRILITHGAVVNTEPGLLGTPLHLAAITGAETIFDLLLEKGANVDVKDEHLGTIVRAAAGGGSEKILGTALHRCCVTSGGLSLALISACRRQSPDCVEALLNSGANVNFQDQEGNSPLSAALVGKGVRRTAPLRPDGKSPLEAVLDVLFRSGSNLKIREGHLLVAASHSSSRVDLKFREGHPLVASSSSSGLTEQILRRLLEYDESLMVTEQIMIECARNRSVGVKLIAFILDSRRLTKVTENILKAVRDYEVLDLLLGYDPSLTVTWDLLLSAQSIDCMRILLERAGDNIVPGELMLKYALQFRARDGYRSYDYRHAVDFILDRNPQLKVTEKLVTELKIEEHLKILSHANPYRGALSDTLVKEVINATVRADESLPSYGNLAVSTEFIILEQLLRLHPDDRIDENIFLATLKLYWGPGMILRYEQGRFFSIWEDQYLCLAILESCGKKLKSHQEVPKMLDQTHLGEGVIQRFEALVDAGAIVTATPERLGNLLAGLVNA